MVNDMANYPLNGSEGWSADTVNLLDKLIPDLNRKYDSLKNLLQQLWYDLEPDVISLIIETGRCKRCSSME